MDTAITVALIGAMGLIGSAATVAAIQAWSANKKLSSVVQNVDGHLKEALDRMIAAIQDGAGARGELAGRDFTREHMEARG